MTTSTMRSGQVAAAAGVNQQTLRYYERPRAARTTGAYVGRPPALP